MKEVFAHFWKYKSVTWAGAFLDYWCERAMRSRLEPMKKVARMLRAHEELLLNWFRAKGEISSGAVEGLNNKIRVVTRRSYGFRTYDAMEIALYHTLGRLPEPKSAHRFAERGKIESVESVWWYRRSLAQVQIEALLNQLQISKPRP